MSMTLDGEILDGNIPNKQKKIIEAWRVVHQDELRAAWYAYNNDGEILNIRLINGMGKRSRYMSRRIIQQQ